MGAHGATVSARGDAWVVVHREDDNLTGVHEGQDTIAVVSGSGPVPTAAGGDRRAEQLARDVSAAPSSDHLELVVGGEAQLLARSGPGAHRWYVGEVGEHGTVLSNQPRLLAALLDPAHPLDRAHEDVVLGFGLVPGDATLYRGVRVAPPVAPARDPQPPGATDFDSAVDELHRRFVETVEEQAGSSKHVAVLLGGFDSALVAATLVRLGRDVTTYTYTFGDPRYEQRDVACVTSAIGTRERWVPITPELIAEGLWQFSDVFCQPGPQPHYQLHTLEAARRVRADGFDQVLTGDGCDAVFLGYPTVSRRARIMGRLAQVPDGALTPLTSLVGATPVERHLGHVARMARSTLDANRLPMPERGHLPTRYLDDVALARLRIDAPPAQADSVDEVRRQLSAGLGDLDPVRLAFHGNALTGQSRMKVEGAVTATGLRQYTPFTHPRVRDFVAALPVDFLRPPGTSAGSAGKALLVEMVRRHDLVPPSVIALPKQSPADAPVDRWYQGPIRTDLLALLDHLPFEWDRDYVENLLRPKVAEELYRRHVAIGHNALQALGLLGSYASFNRP